MCLPTCHWAACWRPCNCVLHRDAILPLLDDSDTRVREHAAAALMDLGVEPKPAPPVVLLQGADERALTL